MVALLLGSGVLAQPDTSLFGAGAERHVSVHLTTDADTIGPGRTFHLAVRFEIDEQWHMYWKNPGEGGLPPSITVTTPPGYTTGEVLWPRPVAIKTQLGEEYSYFDQVVLFVPIMTPKSLTDATVTMQVDIHWTVCRKVCLMGFVTRDITIATSSRRATDAGTNARLAAFKKRLPKPMAGLQGSDIEFDGETLTLAGPAGEVTRAAFFPVDGPGVVFGTATVTVRDGRFRVSVPVALEPLNAPEGPMRFGGLVTLGAEADDPSYDFQVEFEDNIGLSKP